MDDRRFASDYLRRHFRPSSNYICSPKDIHSMLDGTKRSLDSKIDDMEDWKEELLKKLDQAMSQLELENFNMAIAALDGVNGILNREDKFPEIKDQILLYIDHLQG